MPVGAVTVDEVRARLGGAPAADDAALQEALDVAVAHITALLDPEYRDPDGGDPLDPDNPGTGEPWPADLHDGILIGAVLTYRNIESPTPAAAVEGGQPVVPPIAWDRWTRHRLADYIAAGSWAQ
jgi:hypothetical protein